MEKTEEYYNFEWDWRQSCFVPEGKTFGALYNLD